MLLALAFLLFCTVRASPLDFSFAILTDTHFSDDISAATLARRAVNHINSLAASMNIELVFVTGDIATSSLQEQWVAAKAVFDLLQMPYFPILGNHDIWAHTDIWEEPAPTGDVRMEKLFAAQLARATYYEPVPVHDPKFKVTSSYANFWLQWKGINFLGLDFCTRQHHEEGGKGAFSGPDVHNYPNGTLAWLADVLSTRLTDKTSPIVLFGHHPFECPVDEQPSCTWSFSFNPTQKREVQNMLAKFHDPEQYAVQFAGHLHRWFEGQAFPLSGPKWSHFKQFITDATLDNAAWALVQVQNGKIAKILKMNAP